MNKLITTAPGGFPYVLDDIRWEMDAYRLAFEQLAKAVRNSGTADSILWGCEVTDNTTTFDVAAGAVVINGEIYSVAAVTNLTKAASHTLYIAESVGTYDAAGLKTFQDATSNNTYNIRRAVVSIGIVPGGQINLSTTGGAAIPLKYEKTIHNYIGVVTKISLGDTALDDTGTYNSGGTIIAATTPFKFWKRGNMVELEGGFAYTGGFTPIVTTLLGTLPTGYRPNAKIMMSGYSYGSDSFCPIEINTSGQIYLRADLHNTMMGAGCTINATTGVILNGSFSI